MYPSRPANIAQDSSDDVYASQRTSLGTPPHWEQVLAPSGAGPFGGAQGVVSSIIKLYHRIFYESWEHINVLVHGHI